MSTWLRPMSSLNRARRSDVSILAILSRGLLGAIDDEKYARIGGLLLRDKRRAERISMSGRCYNVCGSAVGWMLVLKRRIWKVDL